MSLWESSMSLISHETAHHLWHHVVLNNDIDFIHKCNHEDLGMCKFDSMYHIPRMVGHMMPKMAHDINTWLEPNNGIYFT
jgi:hypothetical protein